MTAGYFDKHYLRDVITNTILNNPSTDIPSDVRAKFRDGVTKAYDNYFRRTVCRMGRFFAKDMARLAGDIASAAASLNIPANNVFNDTDTYPIFVLGADFKKLMLPWSKNKKDDGSIKDTDVVVFTNVTTTYTPYAARSMLVVQPYAYFFEHFSKLLAKHEADLDDPAKAKKWEGAKRTRRNLWRPTVMSMAKFLTNHTNLPHTQQSSIIRDIAEIIEESRKPIDVHFYDTPQDFVTLYDTGPTSCMSVHNGSEHRRWEFLVKEHGVHPTSFFAHTGWMRGVAIKRGGKILARTLLYKQEDGSWRYGRVYPNDPATRDRFTTALGRAGFKVMSGVSHGGAAHCYTPPAGEFKVPGVKIPGSAHYAMPLPYFDNINSTMYVAWDKNTKEFTVVPAVRAKPEHKGWYNAPSTYTGGYISSAQCGILKCAHCNKTVNNSKFAERPDTLNQYTHITTGDFYCSDGCLSEAGMVRAKRGDGSTVVDNKDNCVPDAKQFGTYYQNERFAVQLGAFPLIDDGPFVLPEDYEYTQHGYERVSIAGEIFSIMPGVYQDCKKLKLPTMVPMSTTSHEKIDLNAHEPIRRKGGNKDMDAIVQSLLDGMTAKQPLLADGTVSEEWLQAIFNDDSPTASGGAKQVRDSNGNTIQVSFVR